MPLVPAPKITVGGNPLPAARVDDVVDVRVVDDIGAPAAATVRFYDQYFELLEGGLVSIGDALVIAFPNASGSDVTVFDGEVTAVGAEQGGSDRHEFVVVAHDRSQPLAHGLTPTTYTEMSVGDIVKKIAGRNRLSATVSLSGGVKFEYFLQQDSDMALLDDLAARTGAEWWVAGKMLHFGRRELGSPITLTWGDDLARLSVRYSAASRLEEVTVRGWDPKTQKSVEGKATRGSVTAKKVGTDLEIGTKRSSQAKVVDAKSTVTDVPVAAADEAKELAAAIQADRASGEMRIQGEAIGRPEVAVAATVQLAKVGKHMKGSFVVTRVEHVFGAGRPLLSRFEGGRLSGGGLADHLLAADRAAARNRRTFAIGTVTNVKDPDKVGRVKVKLPVVSDTEESTWARVMAPGAGKERGLHLMPDVGDEVLVAFLGGDTRFPVVLGGLWNQKAVPPTADPVKGDAVKTRSIKLASGAEIAFTEGPAADAVVAIRHADKETALVFDKDGVKLTSKDGTKISIKVGKASLELAADGAITVKGGAVTIKAEQDLVLQGNKVTIKGATGALVDGGGSKVDLGPGGAKLQSGAIVEVKGAMVKLN